MTHLNRRNLIAGAAALPILELSESAANPVTDPIFDAIQKHRAASSYFSRCLEKAATITASHMDLANGIADKKMQCRMDFEVSNPEHKFACSHDELRSNFRRDALRELEETPEGIEAATLEQEGGDHERAAACALFSTAPTTLQGCVTLLRYVQERGEYGDELLVSEIGDDHSYAYDALVAILVKSLSGYTA